MRSIRLWRSLPQKRIRSIHFRANVTQITLTTTADKPLRRDAELNRQRILEAARELFAERGLGVTLNDIAHHAGVGVGTVYRRFPDKAQLIDELFEQRVEELVALMDVAVADPDPWHGLIGFLHRMAEVGAADRALKDILTSTPDGAQRVCRIRDRLMPGGAELVRRAQAEGKLRQDIAVTDMPMIQLMLGALMDASREVSPDLWRRYLALFVRGMAADTVPTEPLSQGPLPGDDVDQVMASARTSGR
jgi:AcrR family transcriptional regulator